MDSLFSTHPNTDNRIAALQAMARDMAAAQPAGAAPGADARADRTAGRWPARPMGQGSAARAAGRTGTAEAQSVGPQPDRTQRSVVVSGASSAGPHIQAIGEQQRRTRSVAGLAARKAAARLLAAVIDARTPLDGLTDHENGHPQYKALDLRDRGLVRAILVTALRFRVTIGRLLVAPAGKAAAAQRHGAVAHPACRGGADPVPRHSRQRRRRPRRDPRQIRSAHAALFRPRQRRAAHAGARQGHGIACRHACRHRRSAKMVLRPADGGLWRRQGRSRSSPRTGSRRRSISPSSPTRSSGPKSSAASCCRPARSGSKSSAASVTELPGFAEGEWWVQDAAASFAGAAVRRRRRLARRRPLRRARRQDRAADPCRRKGHRHRHLEEPAGAADAAISNGSASTAKIVQADMLNYQPDGTFRRRSARRALLVDRHRAAASRRAMDEDRWPTSKSSPTCRQDCSPAPSRW